MELEAYRELRVLSDLSRGEPVTQRSLARRQGFALGLTNLLIRRLVKKGYVKIVNMTRNRLLYLITPRGVTEKARLTYEFLEYSLYFYRQVRAFLTRALAELPEGDPRDILLFGTGEVAEIAFLLLQQHGLRVTAVVDEYASGGAFFMNQPVRSLAELPEIVFDRVVVASLSGRRRSVERLIEWGVPAEKIIAIPDEQTPEFRDDELTGSRAMFQASRPAPS